MNVFIQNHPGEGVHHKLDSYSHKMIFALSLGASIFMSIATFVASYYFTSLNRSFYGLGVIFWILFGFVFMLIFMPAGLYKRKFMLSEQRKYYRESNLELLPENKRLALSLYAHRAYEDRHWAETLELFPTSVRFNGKKKPRFFTLPVQDKSKSLKYLKEWWGIDSETKYVETIEQLFDGARSLPFAYKLQYGTAEEIENLVNRLSGFKDLNNKVAKDYAVKCFEINSEHEGKLFLGFDALCVLQVARWGFTAGLVSEERAWNDILKATDSIYVSFDNEEDYFKNYLLGLFLWMGDKSRVSSAKQKWFEFKKLCNWPITKVQWPNKNSYKTNQHELTDYRSSINAMHKIDTIISSFDLKTSPEVLYVIYKTSSNTDFKQKRQDCLWMETYLARVGLEMSESNVDLLSRIHAEIEVAT